MAVDTGAEGCDAFPLQSFLDFDIRDGPDGAVVAFLEVDDRHLNPNGIVHGGVVFTLADTAMGRATMAVLGDGQICASIEVSVRYLRPIPGGRLVATASVLRAGRRIVHLECGITVDGDDRPVAVLQGSFAVLEA
ncbi:MAG: PaaI family thioesterase [Actinomycetota bacterium]|jgi:acyl-CoA thioesterase|nr:PaaI family thioesterase [Actinomycetota bacterium]